MEREELKRLERLNQLSLTESQRDEFLAFLDKRGEELSELDGIDTENTERMVHVLPLSTVVREDEARKLFDRDELQKGAPETMDGYWQVPRLVE